MRSSCMIKRANNFDHKEGRMSTSPLYHSTRQALQQALPAIRSTQLDTLALIVASATQTQSAHLGALARALPLSTTQDSKEQRIRRFLDNPRITQASHYRAIARAALSGVTNQRVDLALDRVLLTEQHNLLVASVGFRRRSVPLAWKTLSHLGRVICKTNRRFSRQRWQNCLLERRSPVMQTASFAAWLWSAGCVSKGMTRC